MEDSHFFAADDKGTVAVVFGGCGGARAPTLCYSLLEKTHTVHALCDSPQPAVAPGAYLAECERTVLAQARDAGWLDATTAVALATNCDCLTVAWVGDSRAVLAKRRDGPNKGGVEGLTLTTDHNAYNAAEAKRVRAAGGAVGRSEQEARAGKA